jgi:phenylacetate-coenzyme A ligase PaaK-like adenylate-forming protein
MFETALAQLRFASSMLFGHPFSTRSLTRIVKAMQATEREFGVIGDEGAELLGGPVLDEETRRELQIRRFRKQAVRAARETAYYGALFRELDLDPSRLRWEDIGGVPRLGKGTLRTNPDAFVRRSATPTLRVLTTGTTGWPASIYFSADELGQLAAFSAIGLLFQRQLAEDDVVQISISSRALLGSIGLGGACAHLGAPSYLTGLIEPAHALAMLAEKRSIAGKKPRASVLSVYPSYLGELVEHGLRIGYRPADFGLEWIYVGGEVCTEGLKERARQLFGDVRFDENYGMTETIPFGGTRCSAEHLHFEPSQGLLEVYNPETAEPARPGEAGTIVATPFPPFRETTILLRYDTEDMVRAIAEPLECDRRNTPATGNILGKLGHAVRHDHGWTYPRDVLEALEPVLSIPLPVRYGLWAVPGGVAVEVVTRRDTPAVRRTIEWRLAEQGVPLRELHLVDDPAWLRRPLPLRCDLREASFRPHRPDDVSPARRAA